LGGLNEKDIHDIFSDYFFLHGCTVRIADLTMAGTKNLNLETMKIDYARVTKNVEGSDSKEYYLEFP